MNYQNREIKQLVKPLSCLRKREGNTMILGWAYAFKRTKHITGGYETCKSKPNCGKARLLPKSFSKAVCQYAKYEVCQIFSQE